MGVARGLPVSNDHWHRMTRKRRPGLLRQSLLPRFIRINRQGFWWHHSEARFALFTAGAGTSVGTWSGTWDAARNGGQGDRDAIGAQSLSASSPLKHTLNTPHSRTHTPLPPIPNPHIPLLSVFCLPSASSSEAKLRSVIVLRTHSTIDQTPPTE